MGAVQRAIITRPAIPLGAAGDFTTAPEISQMFGEIVGARAGRLLAARAGPPADAVYVELGPGRGTLAADALRVLRAGGVRRRSAFRRDQPGAARGPEASCTRTPNGMTTHRASSRRRPLLLVANEFFDALADPPIGRRDRAARSSFDGGRPGVRPRWRDVERFAGAGRGGLGDRARRSTAAAASR